MTPSQSIITGTAGPLTVADRQGRRLLLRQLTALDTLRLFKAAGPALAQNEAWLSMASLAFSVLEIDGLPIPAPASEAQIESIVERLGDDGIAAIANAIDGDAQGDDIRHVAGNWDGTQS